MDDDAERRRLLRALADARWRLGVACCLIAAIAAAATALALAVPCERPERVALADALGIRLTARPCR